MGLTEKPPQLPRRVADKAHEVAVHVGLVGEASSSGDVSKTERLAQKFECMVYPRGLLDLLGREAGVAFHLALAVAVADRGDGRSCNDAAAHKLVDEIIELVVDGHGKFVLSNGKSIARNWHINNLVEQVVLDVTAQQHIALKRHAPNVFARPKRR